MPARVYFMKTVNGCKDVSTAFAGWTVKTDKFTLFVYCSFLVLLSITTVQSIHKKQIVNIADENLSDYSFLSMYHYTKSKNYLKRRYRIRYWIPMFIGTPCIWFFKSIISRTDFSLKLKKVIPLWFHLKVISIVANNC